MYGLRYRKPLLRKLGPAVVAATFLIVGLFSAPSPALAGAGVGVVPDFPDTATAGDTGLAVGLEIENTSTADVGDVDLTGIFLTPQCGDFGVPCGDPDPGVFSVSTTGTGANGCSGISFTIAEVSASTGEVEFTPDSTITLGIDEVCRVNFTVDVLEVPGKDALGAVSRMQTVQGSRATAVETGGVLPGMGTGTDVATVEQQPSLLETEVHDPAHTDITGGSVAVGTEVHDQATLEDSVEFEAGLISFTLYDNGTCDGDVVESEDVDFEAGLGPIEVETTPTVLGAGAYSYEASYAGDSNHASATSSCEPFTIEPGEEGCGPGFWKNHTDADKYPNAWAPTGYSYTETVDSVFSEAGSGPYASLGSKIVHDALRFKGGNGTEGAARILLRAAVAAMLNAAHPDISYSSSGASIVADVNSALASEDRSTMLALASDLDLYNNNGCYISGK